MYHRKQQSINKNRLLRFNRTATRRNLYGKKFTHLRKRIKRNHILASKRTAFVNRMSGKKPIYKKPSNNIFLIQDFYLFSLASWTWANGSSMILYWIFWNIPICYFCDYWFRKLEIHNLYRMSFLFWNIEIS